MKNTIEISVDTHQLDEAIEKANRLCELLKEVREMYDISVKALAQKLMLSLAEEIEKPPISSERVAVLSEAIQTVTRIPLNFQD